jgi:hypothetical protein
VLARVAPYRAAYNSYWAGTCQEFPANILRSSTDAEFAKKAGSRAQLKLHTGVQEYGFPADFNERFRTGSGSSAAGLARNERRRYWIWVSIELGKTATADIDHVCPMRGKVPRLVARRVRDDFKLARICQHCRAVRKVSHSPEPSWV